MTALEAESRPVGGGFTASSSNRKGTPRRRQKPAATHIIAEAVEVTGGTGRLRWLILFRCLLCGSMHVAHGRGELPAVLERPAACKRGRVALHPYSTSLGGAA